MHARLAAELRRIDLLPQAHQCFFVRGSTKGRTSGANFAEAIDEEEVRIARVDQLLATVAKSLSVEFELSGMSEERLWVFEWYVRWREGSLGKKRLREQRCEDGSVSSRRSRQVRGAHVVNVARVE